MHRDLANPRSERRVLPLFLRFRQQSKRLAEIWRLADRHQFRVSCHLQLVSERRHPPVGPAALCVARAAMLSGAPSPAALCFTLQNDANYLPSDLDGPTAPKEVRLAIS